MHTPTTHTTTIHVDEAAASLELDRVLDDLAAALCAHSEDAYKSLRRLNHLTVATPTVPAPVLYDALGSLKQLGPALRQALDQLATGLARSVGEYDVYEDDDSDPALSVTKARASLTAAADLAIVLGVLLEDAQTAINRQGHRGPRGHRRKEAGAR